MKNQPTDNDTIPNLPNPTPSQIIALRAWVLSDLVREIAETAPDYLQPALDLIATEANAIGFDILSLPDWARKLDLEELIQMECVAQ